MVLGSAPVLNAIHLIREHKIRPTAKIDGGPYFILDF